MTSQLVYILVVTRAEGTIQPSKTISMEFSFFIWDISMEVWRDFVDGLYDRHFSLSIVNLFMRAVVIARIELVFWLTFTPIWVKEVSSFGMRLTHLSVLPGFEPMRELTLVGSYPPSLYHCSNGPNKGSFIPILMLEQPIFTLHWSTYKVFLILV